MNISFAWTTPALLALKKSVTRRCWSDFYAARFKPGDVCKAWSASPHRGGKHIADIEIVDLRRESLERFKDEIYAQSELAAEGGLWGSAKEFVSLFPCKNPWRIEFKVLRTIKNVSTEKDVQATLSL